MFSQTVEYALRAAVYLAQRQPNPCTTMEVATKTHLPQAYLAKILLSLGRAGIVSSQRGLHGGFVLARDAKAISILEVVQAVEPIQRILTCPLGLKTHRKGLCPLHSKLDAAMESIESSFSSTSLADLLSDARGIAPLCESSTKPLALVPLKVTAPRAERRPTPASTRKSPSKKLPENH